MIEDKNKKAEIQKTDTPKFDAFVKKGTLRCATGGALTRKIMSLAGAAVVALTAMAPMTAEAGDWRHREKRTRQTWDILAIINGGLNGVGALSKITASFFRRADVQSRLNAEVEQYNLRAKAIDTAFEAQVGSAARNGDPRAFTGYVEDFLAYKKAEATLTPEQQKQYATLSALLGRSGQATAWLLQSAEYYNECVDAKLDGKNFKAKAAFRRFQTCWAEAGKLDPKLVKEFQRPMNAMRDENGKYSRDSILMLAEAIRTTTAKTDSLWAKESQKQLDALHKEYTVRINKAAKELANCSAAEWATVQRELGTVLGSTLQITGASIDLDWTNTTRRYKTPPAHKDPRGR